MALLGHNHCRCLDEAVGYTLALVLGMTLAGHEVLREDWNRTVSAHCWRLFSVEVVCQADRYLIRSALGLWAFAVLDLLRHLAATWGDRGRLLRSLLLLLFAIVMTMTEYLMRT